MRPGRDWAAAPLSYYNVLQVRVWAEESRWRGRAKWTKECHVNYQKNRKKWEENPGKSNREGKLLTMHLTVRHHFDNGALGYAYENVVSLTRLLCYAAQLSTATLSIETLRNAIANSGSILSWRGSTWIRSYIVCIGMPMHLIIFFFMSLKTKQKIAWDVNRKKNERISRSSWPLMFGTSCHERV